MRNLTLGLLIAAVLAAVAVSGCGNRGPLYLPEEARAGAAAG